MARRLTSEVVAMKAMAARPCDPERNGSGLRIEEVLMRVTIARLILTDGTTSTVGVYRATLCGPRGHRYVDLNAADVEHIATEVVIGGLADYHRELETKYVTASAPAIDWSK